MSVPQKRPITPIRLKLAKRLRDLRKKHKMTQEEAAHRAGINFTYYVRLESKRPNAASIDVLQKLGKAFKITPSKLIDF